MAEVYAIRITDAVRDEAPHIPTMFGRKLAPLMSD